MVKKFTKAEVLGCITGRALYMEDPCCKDIMSHILSGYPVSELTILFAVPLVEKCQSYLASNFVLLNTLAKQLEKHYGDDITKWEIWADDNSDWLLNEYVEVGQL